MIAHLISGCPVLPPNEYKNWHDRLGQYLHWDICKHYKIKTSAYGYEDHSLPLIYGKMSQSSGILKSIQREPARLIDQTQCINDREENMCRLINIRVSTDIKCRKKNLTNWINIRMVKLKYSICDILKRRLFLFLCVPFVWLKRVSETSR